VRPLDHKSDAITTTPPSHPNSWKIISRLITLTFPLPADPSRIYSTRNILNFSRNRSGVGKIVDVRHLSRHISEAVQDSGHVAVDH